MNPKYLTNPCKYDVQNSPIPLLDLKQTINNTDKGKCIQDPKA